MTKTNPYGSGTYFLSGEDMRDALESLGEIDGPSVVTDAALPLNLERREHDPVRAPAHYTDGPVPGMEAIEVAIHFPYALGCALKYIFRAGRKGDAVEDLRKAQQYLQFHIDALVGGRIK